MWLREACGGALFSTSKHPLLGDSHHTFCFELCTRIQPDRHLKTPDCCPHRRLQCQPSHRFIPYPLTHWLELLQGGRAALGLCTNHRGFPPIIAASHLPLSHRDQRALRRLPFSGSLATNGPGRTTRPLCGLNPHLWFAHVFMQTVYILFTGLNTDCICVV